MPVHLQIEKKERKPPKVRTAAATVECPSMPTPQSPVSTSVVVELDGYPWLASGTYYGCMVKWQYMVIAVYPADCVHVCSSILELLSVLQRAY